MSLPKRQPRHPRWPGAKRYHITLDAPPDVTSACHLPARTSGPRWDLGVSESSCRSPRECLERVTKTVPLGPCLPPLSSGQVIHQRSLEVQGPRSATQIRLHKPEVPGHQGNGAPAAAGMLPPTQCVLRGPGQHPSDGRDDSLQGLTAAGVSAARAGVRGGGRGSGVPACRGWRGLSNGGRSHFTSERCTGFPGSAFPADLQEKQKKFPPPVSKP